MIVPERFRHVIVLVLINILKVTCGVTRREVTSATTCRQLTDTSLDCSNLSLTSIPNDIPNTTLALNMSFNNLVLSEATFAECCRHIEELDLSSNGISVINRDTFEGLASVIRLFLRNNSIGTFDPDAFSNKKLERLDLSRNPLEIVASPGAGFIRNARLEELNLDDCDLAEIPDGAFHDVPQLRNLTLDGNPFDFENFDASAFEDLTSLLRLQMKNVSRDIISDLCEKLSAIDSINFEGFNLSCFVLQSEDGNFDDAIVGLDAPIEQPIQLPILPAPTKSTAAPTTTSTTATTATAASELPTEKSNSSSTTLTLETNDGASGVTNSPETTSHAVVDIDNETIKYILIGILGVTLAGILVGFVCRADLCGIKTKLCRSKKSTNNRRSPDDTIEF